MISPRDYQRTALDCTIAELREKASTLVDMATGTGKTFFFAWLCMLLGGRVLVLVHRDELKRQACEKILRVCPDIGITIEQGQSRGDTRRARNLFGSASQVVVASKDTLSRPARLKRYRPDDFDFVIVDEAHRVVRKNESYAAILRYFCSAPVGTGRAKLIGVSASLDRLDGEALGGIFQSVAFRYALGEAINDGYLLKPKVKRAHIKNVKLRELPTRRTPEGDLEITAAALDRVLASREYGYGIAKSLLEVAGDSRQGVVFCSRGPAATVQAAILNAEKPGCAALCLGEPWQSTDERRAAQERLRMKDVQFLVTCDVLTEGWDYDGCEIVVLKPSHSRSRIAQMAGRGTRPLDGCVDIWNTAELRKIAIANSPKPWCTLIDPCGASEEHSLVNVTDIFDGRYTPAGTKPKEPPKPTIKPDDADARRALRRALDEIEEEKLEGLRVDVDFELLDTDMMGEPTRKAGAVSRAVLSHPASEAQCQWLEAHGFRVVPGLTKSEASNAISSIKARLDAGPATPAQKRLLNSLGQNFEVTRGEARARLDELLNPKKKETEGSGAQEAES